VIALALVLAFASATLTNLAYLREHDAAVALPELSARRPLRSARELLSDRRWLGGFGMETLGFALFVAAVALAPLALVQSVAAGGIGILALASARIARRRLSGREVAGVLISIVGLAALAVSLSGRGATTNGHGGLGPILLWLGGTAALSVLLLTVGRHGLGRAVADGLAGGLLFSIGDISTKLATQGGWRILFGVSLVLGYALGTMLLQSGYQAGAAVTVAGLATLLTNALPIAAGTVVLDEPVPGDTMRGVRIAAFVAVLAGGGLLARPEPPGARAAV
jgi:hypothetical protein